MIFIDSFSGAAGDLPVRTRGPMDVLAVLEKNPRLSVFDMSATPWLCRCIDTLLKQKLIVKADEPYPWHRWTLTVSGKAALPSNAVAEPREASASGNLLYDTRENI